MHELPDPQKLDLGDGLLTVLSVETGNILDKQFFNKKRTRRCCP